MVDLSRLTFKLAASMPDIPHEYVVRNAENEADYVALFHTVRRDGVNEKFGGRVYRYWYVGGWKYWTMTTDVRRSHVINRAKIADERDDPEIAQGGVPAAIDKASK